MAKVSKAPGDLLKWGDYLTVIPDFWDERQPPWKKSGLSSDPGTHVGRIPMACAERFRASVPAFEIRPSIYRDNEGVTGLHEMALVLHWREVSTYPMKLAKRGSRGGWTDARMGYAIAELKREAAVYAWKHFCRPGITAPRGLPGFAGYNPSGARRNPRARARRNPRAREEWFDEVTGLPVRGPAPGAARTGRMVTRVAPEKGDRPRSVEVDRDYVNKADVSYGIDADEVPDLRSRALRERTVEETAAKKKRPRYRQTFKTGRAAAKEFFDNNSDFFTEAASSDPYDAVSDFFDSLEVRSKGNKWRSFKETAKGRAILEKMKVEPVGAIMDTLTWMFGQASKRRWDAVSWSMVDGLAAALRESWNRENESGSYSAETFQSGGTLGWYPPAAGHGGELPDFEAMDPDDADRVAAGINADALAEDLARLRRAYQSARKTMDDSERKVARRRVRHLRSLVQDPSKIARTMLCQPEGFSRVCGYPVLHAEIGRLEAMAGARTQVEMGNPSQQRTPVLDTWVSSLGNFEIRLRDERDPEDTYSLDDYFYRRGPLVSVPREKFVLELTPDHPRLGFDRMIVGAYPSMAAAKRAAGQAYRHVRTAGRPEERKGVPAGKWGEVGETAWRKRYQAMQAKVQAKVDKRLENCGLTWDERGTPGTDSYSASAQGVPVSGGGWNRTGYSISWLRGGYDGGEGWTAGVQPPGYMVVYTSPPTRAGTPEDEQILSADGFVQRYPDESRSPTLAKAKRAAQLHCGRATGRLPKPKAKPKKKAKKKMKKNPMPRFTSDEWEYIESWAQSGVWNAEEGQDDESRVYWSDLLAKAEARDLNAVELLDLAEVFGAFHDEGSVGMGVYRKALKFCADSGLTLSQPDGTYPDGTPMAGNPVGYPHGLSGATFKGVPLPPGISVAWSRVNQAYFVMWYDSVLRVIGDDEEVKLYLRELGSGAEADLQPNPVTWQTQGKTSWSNTRIASLPDPDTGEPLLRKGTFVIDAYDAEPVLYFTTYLPSAEGRAGQLVSGLRLFIQDLGTGAVPDLKKLAKGLTVEENPAVPMGDGRFFYMTHRQLSDYLASEFRRKAKVKRRAERAARKAAKKSKKKPKKKGIIASFLRI